MTIANCKPQNSDLSGVLRGLISRSGPAEPVTLTPELAWRILDELNFGGQRKVKKSRMQTRLRAIENGTWDSQASVIVIAVMPDGRMVLIDGQHRLYAIHTHGAPVATCVKLVSAQDEDHLKRLYALFDMKESARTDVELLSATGLSEILGVKFKTAEILLKAVAVIENGMEPEMRAVGKEELRQFDFRSERAPHWDREARDYDAILAEAEPALRRKLLRAGTMAVALYTLKHQRPIALDFWRGLVENDGLRKYDPRARLHVDLLTRTISNGSARQAVQQPVSAWNAFYENRDLKIIKCISGAQIVIKGTPLNKGSGK